MKKVFSINNHRVGNDLDACHNYKTDDECKVVTLDVEYLFVRVFVKLLFDSVGSQHNSEDDAELIGPEFGSSYWVVHTNIKFIHLRVSCVLKILYGDSSPFKQPN